MHGQSKFPHHARLWVSSLHYLIRLLQYGQIPPGAWPQVPENTHILTNKNLQFRRRKTRLNSVAREVVHIILIWNAIEYKLSSLLNSNSSIDFVQQWTWMQRWYYQCWVSIWFLLISSTGSSSLNISESENHQFQFFGGKYEPKNLNTNIAIPVLSGFFGKQFRIKELPVPVISETSTNKWVSWKNC